MANTHNIDIAVRGFKDLLAEIENGVREYFYVDFAGGMENERELIAALKEEAEASGLAFEVEYDEGELVIWAGKREFFAGGYDE